MIIFYLLKNFEGSVAQIQPSTVDRLCQIKFLVLFTPHICCWPVPSKGKHTNWNLIQHFDSINSLLLYPAGGTRLNVQYCLLLIEGNTLKRNRDIIEDDRNCENENKMLVSMRVEYGKASRKRDYAIDWESICFFTCSITFSRQIQIAMFAR